MKKKGIIVLVAIVAVALCAVLVCVIISCSKGKAPSTSWIKENLPDDVKEYSVHVGVTSHVEELTAKVTDVNIIKEKTSKDENIQECEVTLEDEYAKRTEFIELRTKAMDGGEFDITSYTPMKDEVFEMTPKLVTLGADEIIESEKWELRQPNVKINGLKVEVTYNANRSEDYYDVEGPVVYENQLRHRYKDDKPGRGSFPRSYKWTNSSDSAFDGSKLRCTLNIDGKWKATVDNSYKVAINFKHFGGYEYDWNGTCDSKKGKGRITFEPESTDDGITHDNEEMLVCAPDNVEFSGDCSFGSVGFTVYINKDRAEIEYNGFYDHERSILNKE